MIEPDSKHHRAERFTKAFLQASPIALIAMSKRFGIARDDAMELFSEVLLSLVERIHDSDSLLPFELLHGRERVAYVLRVALNRYRDRVRHSQVVERSKRELLDALESGSTPEQELVQKEQRTRIFRAVERLPDTYRALFLALLTKDITLAEYAASEGLKPATINQRFRRGLDLLRYYWQRP